MGQEETIDRFVFTIKKRILEGYLKPGDTIKLSDFTASGINLADVDSADDVMAGVYQELTNANLAYKDNSSFIVREIPKNQRKELGREVALAILAGPIRGILEFLDLPDIIIICHEIAAAKGDADEGGG